MAVVEPHYPKAGNGRRPMPPEQMLRVYFAEVRDLLEKPGLLLKSGTIVDATIINAPSSTNNAEKERDPRCIGPKRTSSGTSA